MKNKKEVLRKISDFKTYALYDNSIEYDWALEVIDDYFSSNEQKTFGYFELATEFGKDPEKFKFNIMQVFNMLSSSGVDILKLDWTYIDEDNNRYVLTNDQFRSFNAHDILFHPENDQRVENPEDKVFMYFSYVR